MGSFNCKYRKIKPSVSKLANVTEPVILKLSKPPDYYYLQKMAYILFKVWQFNMPGLVV